jgi:hypothetical protein
MGPDVLDLLPQFFDAFESPKAGVSLAACHALELLAAWDAAIFRTALDFAQHATPHVRAHVWRLLDEGLDPQRDHAFVKQDVMPVLFEAVHDPEPDVRHAAAAIIAYYLPPAFIPAWLELVAQDADLGWEAWERIEGAFGLDALPHLERAMSDPRPIVRRHAVMYLGFIRQPEAIDRLLLALNDPDIHVHLQAANTLSLFAFYPSLPIYEALRQHPHAISMLRQALHDSAIDIRLIAAEALLHLDVQTDSQIIRDIMALLNDQSPWSGTKRTIGDRMREILGRISTNAAKTVSMQWKTDRQLQEP